MRQRWLPVGILAVALFAVNVVTRLVIRLGFDGDETAQNRATLVMFALIGVVLAMTAFLRARRALPSVWLPEVVAAAVGGLLLTILVGPFVSGDTPFAGGAGNFFSQVWLYGGCAIVGTLIGYWTATALAVDQRSKNLQAFATAKQSKPRRVVRR